MDYNHEDEQKPSTRFNNKELNVKMRCSPSCFFRLWRWKANPGYKMQSGWYSLTIQTSRILVWAAKCGVGGQGWEIEMTEVIVETKRSPRADDLYQTSFLRSKAPCILLVQGWGMQDQQRAMSDNVGNGYLRHTYRRLITTAQGEMSSPQKLRPESSHWLRAWAGLATSSSGQGCRTKAFFVPFTRASVKVLDQSDVSLLVWWALSLESPIL